MPHTKLFDTKNSTEQEISLAHQIVFNIEHSQLSNAILLLHELTDGQQFSKSWLQATEYALKTEDWSVLSEGFIRQDFIGNDRYFLLIAPHQIYPDYGKSEAIQLSAILGRILPLKSMAVQQVEQEAIKVFGRLLQPITDVIPIEFIASTSHFNGENSEAFIVPESWIFPKSVEGPILNNLVQHRKRFKNSVRQNILRIFDLDTANLLLNSLADETTGTQIQHVEYQYHDAGHATGLGLRNKLKDNLLSNYWLAAVEEWRADSVEFDLAMRTLPIAEVGKLIAANFCLRFGIDGQRLGGYNSDTHATCSLITLEYLIRSSAVHLKKGKIFLRDLDYQTLAKSIEVQRSEAVSLTLEELSVESPTGIIGCYHSIKVHQSTKEIFREFVMAS